jgi:polyisoprenoid-binding protein YceI
MPRRRVLLAIAATIGLLVALAFGGLWYFFLRATPPPPVSLEAAATAAAGAQPATARAADTSALADLSGTWSIPAANGSFAGYRVNENLAAFGSRTAVGRTQAVQGTLNYDGHTVSGVNVTGDLTMLKSDQSLRDDTLKMQAIQSCRYPATTFDLATPVTIDSAPAEGASIAKTVQGNLTLHGVTRPVSIDVKSQLQNGQLVVVGSTTIKFSDYNIAQPRSVYVVSLDDHGIMEFQLIFTRANGVAAAATPQPVGTPTSGCSFGPPPGGSPPTGGPGPGGPGGFPQINTPAPVPSPVD